MKSYDNNPPIATAVVISDSNIYDSPSALVDNSGIVQYHHHINETGAREFLSAYPYCWPKGLQDTLISQSLVKFPFRFFICDDSGSV